MTWGRLLYFPIWKEGILKDFLTLIKNPKASAGFELAILGTAVRRANQCATEASKFFIPSLLFDSKTKWIFSTYFLRLFNAALQILSALS